jgi:hypothetical protein
LRGLFAAFYPVTQVWDFRFSLTKGLPSHKKCPGKISDRILVDEWAEDLPSLLG